MGKRGWVVGVSEADRGRGRSKGKEAENCKNFPRLLKVKIERDLF